jgi:hypothetical protein
MNLCSVDIIGGLGNHLFQIAMILFYSKKSNKKIVLNNKELLPDRFNQIRKTFWDTLFKDKFDVVPETDYNKMLFHTYYESHAHKYVELPFEYSNNILFKGYFQSFKYIDDDIRKQMIDLVYSNADLMYDAYEKYNNIKTKFGCEDDDMVSIHIRRTDFILLKDFHNNLTFDYYKDALKTANKKYITVFSDDIEWCKQNINKDLYEYIDIHFVDINNVEIEFILMSMFQHNIIANSTFSLWASFISTYQQPKIIIAPKIWYGSTGLKEHNEVYHKYITHIM